MEDCNRFLFVFIAALLRFFPDLTLVLLSFPKHFRRSIKATYATVFFCTLLLAGTAPLLYLTYHKLGGGAYPFSLSLFYMPCMLLLLRALLDASFSKILFIFFTVRSCTDTMRFFHKFLELRFMPKDVLLYDPTSCMVANLLILTLGSPLIWLFLRHTLCPMLEKNSSLPHLRYLWIIPASYLTLYRLSVYNGSSATDFHDYRLLLLQCVWLLVTCLSYYIVLRMASETAQNLILQEKLKIETIQVAVQNEQYRLLQKNIAKADSARAALRRRLSRIKEHAACGAYDAIENDLEASLSSLQTHESPPLCGNCAVDATLRHYYALARQSGVDFSVSADLPPDMPIVESDLCIVVGNLAENALEACLRQRAGRRFIELKLRAKGRQMVALTVKNSYDGEIHTLADDFFSSKRSGAAFGIGTISVRAIAEKNGGVAKYTAKDNVFQASVLLITPQEK